MRRDTRYEAQAYCMNCGFEGPVNPKVGEGVWSEPCPVCQTKNLAAVAARHARPSRGCSGEA